MQDEVWRRSVVVVITERASKTGFEPIRSRRIRKSGEGIYIYHKGEVDEYQRSYIVCFILFPILGTNSQDPGHVYLTYDDMRRSTNRPLIFTYRYGISITPRKNAFSPFSCTPLILITSNNLATKSSR
ncbi:uncharacterized protein BDZ99DRAFT_125019 [Mytilinidion resinicola]|uniref:Uncharacterized protein n=1 Tax=Mytilinidion resinicola TaxID=574789 RepID=A0A6A6Z4X8_9PEZI|nr:uncharacterized protein BDZ99DRAFT_125019 [Mytilinidion resinicola]KAF2815878.1 hypothetical protein BDZ99DRAFT_125019 [Mytilinidion resinicola]